MSKLNRMHAAHLRTENKRFTGLFEPIDMSVYPPGIETPIAAWRNNRFLVQMFAPVGGGQRLSINRTAIDETTGHWLDGITWDELQIIKRQLGFAERTAIEIYPPDTYLMHVANIRHLWLVDPPAFMWRAPR